MEAVSLSSVFLQQLPPCPPRRWPHCRRLTFASLRDSKPVLLPPSDISAANAIQDNTRSVSRREAVAAISLLLQSLQIAVAVGGNAHALDDSCLPANGRGRDNAQVEPNQILEMAHFDGGGPTLLPKSVFDDDPKRRRLISTPRQQVHTASMVLTKSSGGSLGPLGGIIFGFLFLRERLARTASDNLLEDVRSQIMKLETQLSSRTRSALRLKSENYQASNQVRKGALKNEASLHQVMSIKADANEVEDELRAQKSMFQIFKQKEKGLKAALEKLDKDCRFLTKELDSKLESGQVLKAQLHDKILLLQSKENEINSLKLPLKDQEKMFTEYMRKESVVELALDKAKNKIQDAEKNISRSSKCLLDELEFVESVTEELTVAKARNEISDKKLNELCKNLQEARQSYLAEMAHLKDLLTLKEREACALPSELMTENHKIEASMHVHAKLISEKETLDQVVMNKTDMQNSMKEQLKATNEQLETYDIERVNLNNALNKQLAMLPVERQCQTNRSLLQLVQSPVEEENEIDKKMRSEAGFWSEDDTTTALVQKLLEAREALRASKDEALSIQDRVKSYMSQEAQLKEDIAGLHEKQQGYSTALRKEKRASSYAKKKLVLCEEDLNGETATIQRHFKDLEVVRHHLQDLKVQWSTCAHEMEVMNTRAFCLEEEIALLKTYIENERMSRKEVGKNLKKVASTASKPATMKGMPKTNSLKRNKKHLHLPLENNTAADDALGAPV